MTFAKIITIAYKTKYNVGHFWDICGTNLSQPSSCLLSWPGYGPKHVPFPSTPLAGLPGRVKPNPDGLRCQGIVLLGATGNRLRILGWDYKADGRGQDLNMEIIASQHLTVQAELNLLVGVYVDTLCLTINEVLAYLGIIQMVT